jgi:hypothetical protein
MNLKEYAKKLGLKNMTEEEIVASHQNLIEELKEYRTRNKEMWNKSYSAALKYWKEQPDIYISIEKLRSITVIELAKLLDGHH